MATPFLRALREQRPDSRIIHVGRPVPLAVLAGCPWADETISLADTRRALREIRAARADVALLLPNSFRSALLARRGRARQRIGYIRDFRGWLLTDGLRPPRDDAGKLLPTPAIDYYNALGAHVGLTATRRIELHVRDDEARAADELLAETKQHDGPWVMLNPGAANNLHKLWPPERFAAVADKLVATRDANIIVQAAPGDRPIARQVVEAMQHAPALDFSQRDGSIGLLKGLLAHCGLLVTNDTGARHIAAALGTPVVTVFISTDPEWARIDCPHERIVSVNTPFRLVTPDSPEHHAMRDGVTVEMVLDASTELLSTREGNA